MTEFTAVHSGPELKLRDRNTKPLEKESMYLENKLFLVMFFKNILNSASRLVYPFGRESAEGREDSGKQSQKVAAGRV